MMLRQITSFLGTLMLLGLVFGVAFWLFSRLMQPSPHGTVGSKTATPEVLPADFQTDAAGKELQAQSPTPEPTGRQEMDAAVEAKTPRNAAAPESSEPVRHDAAPGVMPGHSRDVPSPASSDRVDEKALAELLRQSGQQHRENTVEPVRFSTEERREILKLRRQIADLLREKTSETP